MSTPNDSRGGAIAIRGLLVQTIVALLDITKADPPFTEITLEPMVGDDQFDFLWHDSNGSHAVQVKSTENSFTKADVEKWAKKLQQARTNERCRLMLVGIIPPSLAKLRSVDKVTIETKNLNLDDLVEQAAHRVAAFLEGEKLDAGTAKERVMVVYALESKLQHHSTNAKPIGRDEFVMLLRQWIGSVPKPGARIDISRIIKYAPTELIADSGMKRSRTLGNLPKRIWALPRNSSTIVATIAATKNSPTPSRRSSDKIAVRERTFMEFIRCERTDQLQGVSSIFSGKVVIGKDGLQFDLSPKNQTDNLERQHG